MQCQQDQNVPLKWPPANYTVELSSEKYRKVRYQVIPPWTADFVFFRDPAKRYFLNLTFDQTQWTMLPVITY